MRNPALQIGHSPGLRLSTGLHERIVGLLRRSFDRTVPSLVSDPVLGPPVLDLGLEQRSGYARSFPALAATVADGEGRPAGLALVPASCHHVFALWSRRPPRPGDEQVSESWCFRNEGSSEEGRLYAFRQREVVVAGGRDEVQQWRDVTAGRMTTWFAELGLALEPQPANDPFTGAGAEIMKVAQRSRGTKLEFIGEIADRRPAALASANYHGDHFARGFELPAGLHTACAGFGLERTVLAMARRHSVDLDRWPSHLRQQMETP